MLAHIPSSFTYTVDVFIILDDTVITIRAASQFAEGVLMYFSKTFQSIFIELKNPRN